VLRRISLLTTLALALTAAPALADSYHYHLQTQMAPGSATSSRKSGGCSIANGSHGTLAVSCRGKAKATLVYTFSSGSHAVHGQAMGWAYPSGHAETHVATSTKGSTIRLTLTVTNGSLTVGSVCVSYYA
jgi:hypothetical protein